MENYIEAVKAGNWAAAESFWAEEDLKHSRRLGMVYRGVPLKIDSASPLMNGIEGIRSGRYRVEIKKVHIVEEAAEVLVEVMQGEEAAGYTYYLHWTEAGWKLVSPLKDSSTKWSCSATEFVRVYYSDRSKVNKYALEQFDRYIGELAESFETASERRELLRREKLDYYLCDETEIEKLTGYRVQGMCNLQFDAVVSRQLPHYHELTHFMINFALQELPLYTLPFMQEGTAVSFGGRWGKSAEVVLQLGEYMLRDNYFPAVEVLTYDGFQGMGGADFSYPVAGLWVRFLTQRLSGADFKRLYLKFSGDGRAVREMDLDFVKGAIGAAAGMDWGEISREFGEFYPQFRYSGIRPGGYQQADSLIASYNDQSVTVREDEDYYYIEADLAEREQVSWPVTAAGEPEDREYRSWLFAEHFPEREYDGETYGIVITKDEAGCYDYRTNVLLCKYSVFFQGGEGYADSAGVVRFRAVKGIMN
ncbi:MAG: hypothetical protein H8E46_12885 [FCB group bacterium]|nr:hypothetical protein [FCB group bacterium]